MSSTNNRYDDEFKAHAVKMVVEKGRPIRAVAEGSWCVSASHKEMGKAKH